MINAANNRRAADVFQFYPNQVIMKGMIEKALKAYDDAFSKRKVSINSENKKLETSATAIKEPEISKIPDVKQSAP